MQKLNHKTRKKEQLVAKLRGTNYYTLAELAKDLEVDIRTIQRYLIEIRQFSIDIRLEAKVKSYRIFDLDVENNPTFNEVEIKLIWEILTKYNENEITTKIDIKKLNTKVFKLITLRSDKKIEKYSDLIQICKNAISGNNKLYIELYKDRDTEIHGIRISPQYINVDEKKIYALVDSHKNELISYKFENTYGYKLLSKEKRDLYKRPKKDIKKDIFGFPRKKDIGDIKVEIQFDSFVRSQLIRQFPFIEKHVLEKNKTTHDEFSLKVTVYDIEPIGRFVFGVLNKIIIVGDENFKEQLNNYYKKYFEGKNGISRFINQKMKS
jgi:predicted DNA-binding transcriptional regulator YafY